MSKSNSAAPVNERWRYVRARERSKWAGSGVAVEYPDETSRSGWRVKGFEAIEQARAAAELLRYTLRNSEAEAIDCHAFLSKCEGAKKRGFARKPAASSAASDLRSERAA
jgi:hypothetical protein